jgi:hypothetical protein
MREAIARCPEVAKNEMQEVVESKTTERRRVMGKGGR